VEGNGMAAIGVPDPPPERCPSADGGETPSGRGADTADGALGTPAAGAGVCDGAVIGGLIGGGAVGVTAAAIVPAAAGGGAIVAGKLGGADGAPIATPAPDICPSPPTGIPPPIPPAMPPLNPLPMFGDGDVPIPPRDGPLSADPAGAGPLDEESCVPALVSVTAGCIGNESAAARPLTCW
jgi:hypothetical protein